MSSRGGEVLSARQMLGTMANTCETCEKEACQKNIFNAKEDTLTMCVSCKRVPRQVAKYLFPKRWKNVCRSGEVPAIDGLYRAGGMRKEIMSTVLAVQIINAETRVCILLCAGSNLTKEVFYYLFAGNSTAIVVRKYIVSRRSNVNRRTRMQRQIDCLSSKIIAPTIHRSYTPFCFWVRICILNKILIPMNQKRRSR